MIINSIIWGLIGIGSLTDIIIMIKERRKYND